MDSGLAFRNAFALLITTGLPSSCPSLSRQKANALSEQEVSEIGGEIG
jgi:hypothetical protein